MSRDGAHPALHTPPERQHISPHSNIMGNSPELKNHFVPEGWEDFDRGICPCGEVVVWNPNGEGSWEADRQMRVLVLTSNEAVAVEDMLALASTEEVAAARDMVHRQILLQDEVEAHEAAMTDEYILSCPDGHQILGTSETIGARAEIGRNVWPTDDGWDFEHEGGTEIFYDTEETVQIDGEDAFLCTSGDEHKRSTLTLMTLDPETGEYVAYTNPLPLQSPHDTAAESTENKDG